MVDSIPATIVTDKMKKAILSFSEMCLQHPEKKRIELLREIEFRFDLSPRECEFLDKHFSAEQEK